MRSILCLSLVLAFPLSSYAGSESGDGGNGEAVKNGVTTGLSILGAVLNGGDGSANGGGGGSAYSVPGGVNTPLNAQEMECLMKADGADPARAKETAEALWNAMKILNLDESKLSRTCMLHILAQVKTESGYKCNISEGGHGPGHGLIQVTGAANDRMVANCMNAAQSGFGNGVAENPYGTIGAGGTPIKSAAASLCWVDANILKNQSHLSVCNDASPGSDVQMTHIVNGGSVNGGLSNAAAQTVGERMSDFEKLQSADRTTCRQLSI